MVLFKDTKRPKYSCSGKPDYSFPRILDAGHFTYTSFNLIVWTQESKRLAYKTQRDDDDDLW